MHLKPSSIPTLLLLCVTATLRAGDPQLEVTHEQNTDTIPAYEVFEITFEHENEYTDPFVDVTIDVVFTSPSGKRMKVGGFHYGSSAGPKIKKQKTITVLGIASGSAREACE